MKFRHSHCRFARSQFSSASGGWRHRMAFPRSLVVARYAALPMLAKETPSFLALGTGIPSGIPSLCSVSSGFPWLLAWPHKHAQSVLNARQKCLSLECWNSNNSDTDWGCLRHCLRIGTALRCLGCVKGHNLMMPLTAKGSTASRR